MDHLGQAALRFEFGHDLIQISAGKFHLGTSAIRGPKVEALNLYVPASEARLRSSRLLKADT